MQVGSHGCPATEPGTIRALHPVSGRGGGPASSSSSAREPQQSHERRRTKLSAGTCPLHSAAVRPTPREGPRPPRDTLRSWPSQEGRGHTGSHRQKLPEVALPILQARFSAEARLLLKDLFPEEGRQL